MIFGEDSDIVKNDISYNAKISSRRLEIFVFRGVGRYGLQNQFTVTPLLSRPIFNGHPLLSGHLSNDLYVQWNPAIRPPR